MIKSDFGKSPYVEKTACWVNSMPALLLKSKRMEYRNALLKACTINTDEAATILFRILWIQTSVNLRTQLLWEQYRIAKTEKCFGASKQWTQVNRSMDVFNILVTSLKNYWMRGLWSFILFTLHVWTSRNCLEDIVFCLEQAPLKISRFL